MSQDLTKANNPGTLISGFFMLESQSKKTSAKFRR